MGSERRKTTEADLEGMLGQINNALPSQTPRRRTTTTLGENVEVPVYYPAIVHSLNLRENPLPSPEEEVGFVTDKEKLDLVLGLGNVLGSIAHYLRIKPRYERIRDMITDFNEQISAINNPHLRY